MPDVPKAKRRVKPPITARPDNVQIDPSVSMQHERLVGRIVILWGKFEGLVQDAIWLLLDLDEADGRLITQRMDANMLLPLLRTLGERGITDPTLRQELTNILIKMDDAREDRNFVVHGQWMTMLNGDAEWPNHVPMAMSLRAKSEHPDSIMSETFPAGRMHDIIGDIRAGVVFMRRLVAALDPSREKYLTGDLRP